MKSASGQSEREQEIISTLCALCSDVGRKVFDHQEAHDCFCTVTQTNFQFSQKILDYIRTAVEEKMSREGKS